MVERGAVEVVVAADGAEVGRRVRAILDTGGRAAGFVGDPDRDADVLAELAADVTRA